jgi:putative ABC transport system ATP-binding protein
MLELRELVKHYPAVGGEPVRAVDGVSLTVPPGETVALYGPSGSGKTTLLLMIAMLLQPTAGTVLIGKRDIASLSEREASHFRLRELGFIRQSFDLMPGVSAIDNATLKLLASRRWREARREIAPLLERLGLGERMHHRSDTLSMGERQRVMIARALSTEPRLLLADEPTGSLDSKRGREVLELLRKLCRERRVAGVIVSHDPMAALYADRVLALRDGILCDYKIEQARTQPAGPLDGPAAGRASDTAPELAAGTGPIAVSADGG